MALMASLVLPVVQALPGPEGVGLREVRKCRWAGSSAGS